MGIDVVSWAGQRINDLTTYEANLTPGAMSRAGNLVQVEAPGRWPQGIRTNARARTLMLDIAVRGSSLNASQVQLEKWFAPGTEGELIVNEDGTWKVLDAFAVGFEAHVGGSPGSFVATLVAPDPRWRGYNPIAGGRVLSASGQVFTVTNPGNAAIDDAIVTIRPQTAKAASAGQLYAAEVILAWRSPYASSAYPLELTNDWNHSGEVGAGRSLSSGDDVRVLVNGIDRPRWFGTNASTDPNSATTRLWSVLPFQPVKSAKILSAITASNPGADGDLEVQTGGTLGWPRRGAFANPTTGELFTYTGRTESNANGRAAFTGVRRGQRDTTAAAASAGDTVYWVEHRIQIVWGNTGASAPPARDDLKPMLDLGSSTLTNLRWDFVDFMDDRYPGRAAQWRRDTDDFDDQASKVLSPGGSPLSALTFEYQSAGAVSGKPAGNVLYLDLPCGSGSSGGNVASLTRTLADTVGMWIRGVDDAGQKVVLQKFAGALSSASANIAAPTNPVYRLECWAFNQVIAKAPSQTYSASIGVLNTSAGNGLMQQILVGSEPVDVVGLIMNHILGTGHGGHAVSSVGIYPDNASNLPATATGRIATSGASAALAGSADESLSVSFSTPPTLQARGRYWLNPTEDTDTGPSWYVGPDGYNGQRVWVSSSPTLSSLWSFSFALLGRPAAGALSFERFDGQSLADDGDQATVDGVTVYMSSSLTPYVAMKARKSIYRMASATLYNQTTGQSIAVDALMRMHDDLQVDAGAGSAVNLDDETETPFVVEYSDPGKRLTLAPGPNTFQFSESGLAGVAVAVEGYPRWE